MAASSVDAMRRSASRDESPWRMHLDICSTPIGSEQKILPLPDCFKELYAHKHGYAWKFEMLPPFPPHLLARGVESFALAQTVWHKVGGIRKAFDDPHINRCTYLDSDTLVVQP